jgi:hypothetical protein
VQWQQKLNCISSKNKEFKGSNQMGILQDQRHQLDIDSLFSSDPEIRSGAIRRLAARPGGVLQQSARRAEREALAERTKWLWGKDNPSFAIEANFQVMGRYLAQAGIQISDDAYDLAFRACRNQLAERVLEVPEPTAEEKVRAENDRLRGLSVAELRAEVQGDIKRKLASPEFGGWGSTYVPNFTAQEFLRMSPSQVKALIFYEGRRQERPGVRAGLDKLLRDAQILKEATKSINPGYKLV